MGLSVITEHCRVLCLELCVSVFLFPSPLQGGFPGPEAFHHHGLFRLYFISLCLSLALCVCFFCLCRSRPSQARASVPPLLRHVRYLVSKKTSGVVTPDGRPLLRGVFEPTVPAGCRANRVPVGGGAPPLGGERRRYVSGFLPLPLCNDPSSFSVTTSV